MKKSKIDAIHIRRNRFGLTGIVYSRGYTYAPDTVVTEEVIRKSWRERRSAFRAYDDSTDTFL